MRAVDRTDAGPSTAPGQALPAFDAVYREHAPLVFRLLRGMGVADSLADDALQDVFMVVHRRLAEFDGRARISTWLFAIVYRVACRYRRKSRRNAAHTPLSDEFPDPARSPQQALESQRLLGALSLALDKLDDEKRMTILLADLEGLSAPEIAQWMSTPLNTVYTRLRRARAALASELDQLRKEGR